MTCQFCGKVLEPFKNESDEDIFGIPAGDWEDMMEPDCNNCQGLRGRLNAAYSTLSNIDPTCKPSFSFTLEGRKLSVEFRLENSLGSYGLEVCLELMTEASYPWGQGKVMNPDWIDSYLFLKWKSSCDEQHGTCEVSLVLKLSSFPAAELGWFVDVNNFCISNIDELQAVNALLSEEYLVRIPVTIQYAIRVTLPLRESRSSPPRNQCRTRSSWNQEICIVATTNRDQDVFTVGDEKVVDRIFDWHGNSIERCPGILV
ncbi:hypothetical protein BDZ45DRAFT_732383 [Acephala macrosclerotiorum]|nr:hypothetical protein BDZ45DRAFT_732383 [Acephala macrosclerotiorum]